MSTLPSSVGPEAITGPGTLIIALPRECSPQEVLVAASMANKELDLLTVGTLDRGSARFSTVRRSTAWRRFCLGPSGSVGVFIDVEKVGPRLLRATVELGEDPWKASAAVAMLASARQTFAAIREQLSATFVDFEAAWR